jgi:hypothetical protein
MLEVTICGVFKASAKDSDSDVNRRWRSWGRDGIVNNGAGWAGRAVLLAEEGLNSVEPSESSRQSWKKSRKEALCLNINRMQLAYDYFGRCIRRYCTVQQQ